MHEHNGRHRVHIESLVSKQGLTAMLEVLNRNCPRDFSYEEFETLAGGREYVNRQGKITKRIRRNLKRELEITLSDNAVAEIGNIANRNTLTDGDYLVEITSDLQGTVGRFGDSDSCFHPYGSYHNCLMAMENSGNVSAVRIYKPNGAHQARAWAYHDGDGAMVIFNAYGMTLYKIAKIVGVVKDKEFRQVRFKADVWINLSISYAVGGDPTNTHYNAYFGADGYDDYDNVTYCSDCEDQLDEWDETWQDADGFYYCRTCWEDSHLLCQSCMEWGDDDDHTITKDGAICEDCIRRYYIKCDDCEDYYKTGIIQKHTDCNLCKDCTDEYYYCEDCYEPLRGDYEGTGDYHPTRVLCAYCGEEYRQKSGHKHEFAAS